MTRGGIIFSGLLGLTGAFLLTTISVVVMAQKIVPVLLQPPLLVWGLFLFLLTLSLLEIPLMVFTMRRIASSPNPRSQAIVLLTNIAYTFFGSVYAAPFILLAGATWVEIYAGIGLAALSIVRFITSVVFLPYGQQN
jgi:hypothetical protein